MDNAIQVETADTPSKGYRVFKVFRTIFIYLPAAALIIAALLFAASNSPSKSLFGYRYFTVLTPSMEPAYSVGDMVFVKIESADKINVGDVITFNPSEDSEAYLTHRVIEKYPDYQGSGVTCFKTKGDANDSEDSFLIDEDRVIGPVKFCIPKMGYVVRFIQLRWYLIVPLIALVFVFFTLMGIYLDPKKKKSKKADPEGEEAPTETSAPSDAAPADTPSQQDAAPAQIPAEQDAASAEIPSDNGDKEDHKSK